MKLSSPDLRMTWRGADLGKNDIAFDLTRRHAAALEQLLDRFRKRGLGLDQILPEHCRHPALDADLARVFDEIQEGRGIVGLEAMACGCPVVATRCGGTEDYVRDGVNGYLVGFSADEMADAIMRILSDRMLHRTLRAGALHTVHQEYSEAGVEAVFWRQFALAFGQGAA